jgi:DNA-3-methyladenine glycosylase II
MELVTAESLPSLAQRLARKEPLFRPVLKKHGPPPLWAREPGFATLLHIILEQQVSLASAKACFGKLATRVGEVDPAAVLGSTDAELRADGFSRQKATYARHLAEAVISNGVDLIGLPSLPDDVVRDKLKKLKGVGDWTADIYLLMAMLRPDVMPKGDLALHTAWQRLSGNGRPSAADFLAVAERWRPYRSVAARVLWHFYLSERQYSKK